MVRWEIILKGQPYSNFTSKLRSMKHSKNIVSLWMGDMNRMGYSFPEGSYTARPYIGTKLDSYGN